MGKYGIQSYFEGKIRDFKLPFVVKVEEPLQIGNTGRWRVADVLIEMPGHSIVIENQLANQSDQKLSERHEDYLSLGLTPYWVSDNYQISSKIKHLFRQDNLGCKALKRHPKLDEFLSSYNRDDLFSEFKDLKYLDKQISLENEKIQKQEQTIADKKDRLNFLNGKLETIKEDIETEKIEGTQLEPKVEDTSFTIETILNGITANYFKATYDGNYFGLLNTSTKESVRVASVQTPELRKLLNSAVPSSPFDVIKPLTMHPAIANPLLRWHTSELGCFVDRRELAQFYRKAVPARERYISESRRFLSTPQLTEAYRKTVFIAEGRSQRLHGLILEERQVTIDIYDEQEKLKDCLNERSFEALDNLKKNKEDLEIWIDSWGDYGCTLLSWIAKSISATYSQIDEHTTTEIQKLYNLQPELMTVLKQKMKLRSKNLNDASRNNLLTGVGSKS